MQLRRLNWQIDFLSCDTWQMFSTGLCWVLWRLRHPECGILVTQEGLVAAMRFRWDKLPMRLQREKEGALRLLSTQLAYMTEFALPVGTVGTVALPVNVVHNIVCYLNAVDTAALFHVRLACCLAFFASLKKHVNVCVAEAEKLRVQIYGERA